MKNTEFANDVHQLSFVCRLRLDAHFISFTINDHYETLDKDWGTVPPILQYLLV